jgi:hypothetical protein
MPETLILLVGSNPLPNYLSACALRPSRVVLVHTAETTDAKDRLRGQLFTTMRNAVELVDAFIQDATCATDIGRVIDGVISGSMNGDTWLNYTGGTKVMAAHSLRAFYTRSGMAAHASYLDEGGVMHGPRLRFDDGRSTALAELPNVQLTLATILGLHGISHTPRSVVQSAPQREDATAILKAVLSEPLLASSLYDERERLRKLKSPRSAHDHPFIPGDYSLPLSITQLPTDAGMNRKSFENWCDFIGGVWLEEWLGSQIQTLNLTPEPEIVVGVNAQRGFMGTTLEVDIAVVRAQRSYFISCTTDTTKSLCKSKLFEIAVRSRQLGGELARAALVCLADDDIIGKLQKDIDDVWGATNTTKVFGLSDLKTWSGFDGNRGVLTTLKSWLES